MAEPGARALYAEHCAVCHTLSRLGGTGPALIPETLGWMFGPRPEAVIADGRVATQMPGFADLLAGDDIAAIAAHLAEPLAEPPLWTAADVAPTLELVADYSPAVAPVFAADPMKITLVVDTGDDHVSVLDGDTFDVLDLFLTPFAVHGGPKF